MSALFQPLRVGMTDLQHRDVMAPSTRLRANNDHIHGDLAKIYYVQRSSVPGTLIISEGTFIAPQAAGYVNIPDISYMECRKNRWMENSLCLPTSYDYSTALIYRTKITVAVHRPC